MEPPDTSEEPVLAVGEAVLGPSSGLSVIFLEQPEASRRAVRKASAEGRFFICPGEVESAVGAYVLTVG
jgi:hypothetical protein